MLCNILLTLFDTGWYITINVIFFCNTWQIGGSIALHLYNELKSNVIHLSCLYLKSASEGTSYATQDVPQHDRNNG